jgi:hypothetical protein
MAKEEKESRDKLKFEIVFNLLFSRISRGCSHISMIVVVGGGGGGLNGSKKLRAVHGRMR